MPYADNFGILNMSENFSMPDNEIDLFGFFEELWDGKWKILFIAFISTFLGIVYTVNKPTSYEVTASISPGSSSAFIPYIAFNRSLESQHMNSKTFKSPVEYSDFRFDSELIFNIFVNEFNDYDEMINVLSGNDYVKNSLVGLNEDERNKSLINFAKSFWIEISSKKGESGGNLKFIWHDDTEGRKLFSNAIYQTLLNSQKKVVKSINELANMIDIDNASKLKKLVSQTESVKKQLRNYHANISKREEGQNQVKKLEATALAKSLRQDLIINNEFLEQIQGFIKTSELLASSPDQQDILAVADLYVNLKKEMNTLEIDIKSSQFKTAAKLIEADSVDDWIEFDLALADSKSRKQPKLYLAISLTFGILSGIIYVLFSNAYRKRKDRPSQH